MRTLTIKVKPGTRRSALSEQVDGSYLAELKSPPIDGKANAELIELLAEHFGVRKTDVRIKRGAGSRTKRVEIED